MRVVVGTQPPRQFVVVSIGEQADGPVVARSVELLLGGKRPAGGLKRSPGVVDAYLLRDERTNVLRDLARWLFRAVVATFGFAFEDHRVAGKDGVDLQRHARGSRCRPRDSRGDFRWHRCLFVAAGELRYAKQHSGGEGGAAKRKRGGQDRHAPRRPGLGCKRILDAVTRFGRWNCGEVLCGERIHTH